MRLLLDTHAFLWWLADDRRLASGARRAIADAENTVHVSAASVWEIAVKVAIGKLVFEADPAAEIAANGFLELPITARHAARAGSLPRHHDDPFDRMLVAQASLEELTLVSRDRRLGPYDVRVLWS